MKVVFIGNDKSILTGENGDARERMREYARYFDKLFIVIFCLKRDRLHKVMERNLEIYPTNSSSRWFFVIDALKIIKDLKIELISTQDPFIAGLVGVMGKILFKVKLNIQLHNDFFDNSYFRSENIQNFIFYFLGRFNLLFADSVRTVSKKLVKDDRYFVAPVAVDLDFFKGSRHKKFYNQVVTVARLAKQKNLLCYFDIARKLPNTKFVVVGEGEQREFLEKIKPSNALLLGQKTREQIKGIFLKSDVFVSTSNYEGWGLACIEALASGLPVVMPDIGCAGEAIIDGMMLEQNQKLIREKFSRELLVQKFVDGLKNTK